LFELGYVSAHNLQLALAMQREQPGTPLGEILSQHQFVSEQDVFSVFTDLLGLVRVFPETTALDGALLRRAPARSIAFTDSFRSSAISSDGGRVRWTR